ncbi:MAG: 50S ribosomal protein L16 3-hydroxylase [Phenylobacterium sp.]|jgi:50S ribosomal protein L16 3-hydroxylase
MQPLNIDFKDLSPEVFLQQYWQKKPLLIRSGLNDFIDLISPDELAGLACEPAVQSRLIYQQDQQWQAQTGPFESYDHLCEKDWSLVVQAADNWSPEVVALTEAFNFLPDWRRDDVMISFATPGGSVGPHIDNYDTFICQGSGSRHWRVGDRGDHQQFSAHEALLHVEAFDAIIDVELQPGDILYIPPGYPHEGIALSPSMSFSVGFRTESAKDYLSGLADHLIDFDKANHLLNDPERPVSKAPGLVENQDLARIKAHLLTVLEDDTLLARFSGCHLTSPKHTLDVPEIPFECSEAELLNLLSQQPLYRLGGLRCYYFEQTLSEGLFYVNGEECRVDAKLTDTIKVLCDHQTLTFEMLQQGLADSDFVSLLYGFVVQGCWYFGE